MNILILGNPEYAQPIIKKGYNITYDPIDADIIIADAVNTRSLPVEIETIIILSGAVSDWMAKQTRPDAKFANSIEEALDFLPIPVLEAEPEIVQDRLLLLTHANKGGVGKTTAAISLAEVLAPQVKTLLCDFDFAGPNIGTFYSAESSNYLQGSPKPVKVKDNLWVLPSPKNLTPSEINGDQLHQAIDSLQQFQVIIGDTPPAPWEHVYLHQVFASSDLVYSVVDQSLFTVAETKTYAIKLLAMGVKPDRIRLIINRYNSRYTSPKKIQEAFSAGFKKDVKFSPKIVAHVPENWDAQVKAEYKGHILNKDIWKEACSEVYTRLGLVTENTPPRKKKFALFGR